MKPNQREEHVEKSERESFEQWVGIGQIVGNFTYPDGSYVDPLIQSAWKAWKAASLVKSPESIRIVLAKICAEAESWHTMHGHEDEPSAVQCDSICALIPEMKAALKDSSQSGEQIAEAARRIASMSVDYWDQAEPESLGPEEVEQILREVFQI